VTRIVPWPRIAIFIGIAAIILGAVALEECSGILRVGDRAPGFSAKLSSGAVWTLDAWAGRKNVVLFFYPRDASPGCTRQVCLYRDSVAAIADLDAVVLGVSSDSNDSHERFIAERNLPFPLISDPDGALSSLYGARRLWGVLPLLKRVTYVIDKQRIVRGVIHDEFSIDSHATGVLRILRDLR
jgi:peroxiredoxin Q/BCP